MTWRIFGALVLVLVGLVLLLVNLGILPSDAWNIILPALLVVLGIALLIGARIDNKPLTTVRESETLEGATSAKFVLRHGAGRLNVSAGSNPALLFCGTFVGGVDKKVARENGTIALESRHPTISAEARVLCKRALLYGTCCSIRRFQWICATKAAPQGRG